MASPTKPPTPSSSQAQRSTNQFRRAPKQAAASFPVILRFREDPIPFALSPFYEFSFPIILAASLLPNAHVTTLRTNFTLSQLCHHIEHVVESNAAEKWPALEGAGGISGIRVRWERTVHDLGYYPESTFVTEENIGDVLALMEWRNGTSLLVVDVRVRDRRQEFAMAPPKK